MSTFIISHRAALAHDMGFGHPERPDRWRVVEQVLGEPPFADLPRLEAPEATHEALLLAHPAAYVEKLTQMRVETGRMVRLDGDTGVSAGTMPAALRAAGGAVLAVDEVLARRADNAFVAMRPPGHHAERATAMGFCFFNNAAIAARHAQAKHGLARVAIIDFDVHHGNGTQDIFWDDASVLYGSTHQMPLYPGTGARGERGTHDTIVNAPMRAGDGGAEFRDAFETLLLPRLDRFAPELIIISAGFDAHHRDPLAQMELREEDFAWATLKLMTLADRHAGGRVVSLLEGGYDLIGLALSTAAHVGALMGRGA